jgi:hypothetical protein
MLEGLTRVVGGVEESLCWAFRVHGKDDAKYEAANGQFGPFDTDRKRRLKRGETFQRLDRSGSPREYQGLVWRPKGAVPGLIA